MAGAEAIAVIEFHFMALPGGVTIKAAIAHRIRIVIVTGTTSLRK